MRVNTAWDSKRNDFSLEVWMRGRLLLLVLALLALAGSGAATGEASDGRKSVLVGFESTPGAAEASLVESLGGEVTYRYKYIPVFAATLPEDQISTLSEQANVAYVENDDELYLLGHGKQITDYGITKVQAPQAWALGYRGAGVKVGIFDSGIDLDHPDLEVAGGVDLIGDGNGLDDCLGHGTHVAGIVGARDNGQGTVGVAPKASLYAMRFFDCAGKGATKARELKGLEWAIDNGMQVVNMSFGCCTVGGAVTVPIPSAAEEAAMQAAYDRGIVLIAASGNASEPVVSYPAGYESVVAVGATDDEDQLASFSSYGTDQELTAPGVANFASYLVGLGQRTDLHVDSDGGRGLDAIAMQYAGMTKKSGLTATTIYAGLGTEAEFAGVECTGKTALITRGGITFAQKTANAMKAGCAAAIIHNNQPGNFNGTLGTATSPSGAAWIPVVSISLDEGLYLKNEIDSGTTTTTLLNVSGDQASLSGTSMASPHAAGVATLVVGKNPTLSPERVREILRASSDDVGAPGWDPQYGYGRVNAQKAVAATP